ncbi:hypothetical protein [Pseudoalteromonas ulvae]|uniref:Uncharacterized protein n=1 Tax=Pseudoalteromonas ulvae TaxID=107327 RepID=A0A244CUL5_PSEDV|nr:hypothetical protein [Pseudoalteromonas ulvae]OUL59274.1 hypothetical protein B1199_03115 [Pseudoalteromonas ulvae]
MSIEVNGMKYINHDSYYVNSVMAHLTVVTVINKKTSMTSYYADFINDPNDPNEIEQIIRNGFKPKGLQQFLNNALGEYSL